MLLTALNNPRATRRAVKLRVDIKLCLLVSARPLSSVVRRQN